jgi:hypothetical protein
METRKRFKMKNKETDNEIMPILYDSEEAPYWIHGYIDTPIGKVRVMDTELIGKDKFDNLKARLGINRDDYKVSPGLYAIGMPDSSSMVLVTSNYKLTVDKLRMELGGQKLWILVLDTDGVNVWCAAGKGTFGTAELIGRIKKVKLNKVVEHNRIILPQLSAPGISAHEVTKMTGFKVTYGPILSRDIPEFFVSGLRATEKMREVKFDLVDRFVVTPIEIMHCLKYVPIIYAVFFVLNLIKPGKIDILGVLNISFFNSLPYFLALFTGTLLFPLLLPYLPFKAFSLKGLLLGIFLAVIILFLGAYFKYPHSILIYVGNSLILVSIVSFLGLNFTGSTTYTSLSGVVIETKYTTIITVVASIIGIVLILINSILKFF